jgi:hypothetical protein
VVEMPAASADSVRDFLGLVMRSNSVTRVLGFNYGLGYVRGSGLSDALEFSDEGV